MKKLFAVCGLVLVLALPQAGSAQASIGIAPHIGTLGVGADVALSVSRFLTVRGGVNVQPYDPSFEVSDIDFDIFLPSPNFTALVDLHPTGGGFRITGGFVFSSENIEVEANLTASQEIGNQTFSAADIGTLTGVFDGEDVAPYLGIGFGHVGSGVVGIFFDLGVSFVGEPDVSLSANGRLATEQSVEGNEFRNELAQEERDLQDDAGVLKLYPVIQIGLSFGIF